MHDAGKGARRVLAGVAHAYLPLPVPGPRFWQTQLLALLPGWTAAAWAVGLVVLATAALALATRPLALAYFMSAATGLLLFSYTRVPGALRHHGFHVLALGSAAWLAGHLPRRTAGALTSRLARTARAIRLAVRWDEARLAPYTLWPEVDGIASQARSPVTVVLDYAALMMIPPPASSLARMRGVGCVEGQVERDESFCVFVLWPPGSAPPGVASEAATGAR